MFRNCIPKKVLRTKRARYKLSWIRVANQFILTTTKFLLMLRSNWKLINNAAQYENNKDSKLLLKRKHTTLSKSSKRSASQTD